MPRKRKAPPVTKSKPIPKRSRNHRTAQQPWEACREEEYEVDAILNKVLPTPLCRVRTMSDSPSCRRSGTSPSNGSTRLAGSATRLRKLRGSPLRIWSKLQRLSSPSTLSSRRRRQRKDRTPSIADRQPGRLARRSVLPRRPPQSPLPSTPLVASTPVMDQEELPTRRLSSVFAMASHATLTTGARWVRFGIIST